MKSSFSKKMINNKKKYSEANHSLIIKKQQKKNSNKRIMNNSASFFPHILKDKEMNKDQDEISKLSNANLKILKILNSYANEEILNDSSFKFKNNNHNHNYKNENSIMFSPIPGFKKNKNKHINPNNFELNSNISDFNSEIIFSDKRNDSISIHSPCKFKRINEKEIKKIDNNEKKSKKKLRGGKYSSQINVTNYTLNNNLKIKEKKVKNKDINEHENNTNSNKNAQQNHYKNRERSKSIAFQKSDYFAKNLDNLTNISETGLLNNNNNIIRRFLNEIEIMKINENIHNDIKFMQLKKKISEIKRNIQNKNSKEFSAFKNTNSKSFNSVNSKFNSPLNRKIDSPLSKINDSPLNRRIYSPLHKKIESPLTRQIDSPLNRKIDSPLHKKISKINTIEERSENIENISLAKEYDNEQKNISNQYATNEIIKPFNKNSIKKLKNIKDKFRALIRKNSIFDSIDDEEYKEEEIDFYISPDSWYIKIFDSFLFISSMIYFIFVPYFLSRNYFIIKEYKIWKIIFILIDAIYIIDIIINFFRAYKNFDENLIRRTKKIFLHYLKTWFIIDLIQAIPYFSVIKFLEDANDNEQFGYKFIEFRIINAKLYIILLIKIIKVYKMLYNNSTISYFSEILSRNEILDEQGGFIIIFFIILLVLNMTTCLFIFLGINVYPSWITKLNIQDTSYLYIYLSSIYFIMVTITTVGYGDITGQDLLEIFFQIFLLIIGTIAYSFTISYISNYIVKSNNKSITFEKNLEILQEIKLHHPNMKDRLYKEVLRNLYNEQLYEKKDKHLLFDCLPYSLKNKLISEMYKPIIKNFVFFRDIDNSDFIVKVVTSFKPLIAIKNDIIIQEGDYIKEIFFVKKGIIVLNICIDINEPESSLRKYLSNNKIGKFNTFKRRKNLIDTNFNTIFNNNNFLHKYEEDTDTNNENSTYKFNNVEDIKIIEIRAREHFGDALMFLNERCPLVVKVRSRYAELLILRKMEAIEIYSIYPNIWKRINKKSLYNMEQIHSKIKKIVIKLSNRYKINIDKYINRKKSLNNIKKEKSNTSQKTEEVNYSNSNNTDNKNSQIDIKKIKENIVEFNGGVGKQNKETILTGNMSLNRAKNKTFSKKKSTQKVVNLRKMSQKYLEKNCLLKMSLIIQNNKKDLNKFTDGLKKINTYINYSLGYNRKKRSYSEKHINNSKRSSINPNTFLSKSSKDRNNNSDSKTSSLMMNNLYKKLFTNKEKILHNSFTNLTIAKENTFQLNSSYDNINEISNNKYIKDRYLQSKIKQVLINECSFTNIIKRKETFLKIPSNKFENSPKSSISNDTQFKNNISELLNNETNNNSIIYREGSKTENEDDNIIDSNTNKKFKKQKIKSSYFHLKNNNKFITSSNIIDLRKTKIPIMEKRQIKKKKKPETINKQLNIISENIKNTSNNINNPQEFYLNLFNDIIAKESKSSNDEENKNNNSSILKKNTCIFKKESNLNLTKKEINLSLLKKESNLNLIKKIKKESDLNLRMKDDKFNCVKKVSNLSTKKRVSNKSVKSSKGEVNSFLSNNNLQDYSNIK